MEMSEQDWNDIFVKEIEPSKRGQGLFSHALEDAFERCCQDVGPESMDYCHLQNILNFITTRQWEKIRAYVTHVNETHLRERVQDLVTRAEKDLYERCLLEAIAYKITMLDPWEEWHNLLEDPLRKVFKLLERKKHDEVEDYIHSVHFFRDEIHDHKESARTVWKRILTHHPLSSTWRYKEKETEPSPKQPLVRLPTSYPPDE